MGRAEGMTLDARRMLARWIMFLKSEREYEYPIYGCLPTLVAVLTGGLIRKPDPMTVGASDYWPYFRKSDFDHDLDRPCYLSGASIDSSRDADNNGMNAEPPSGSDF